MSVLTIRDVPEEVHRALRVRAARHGRSIEAEVCAILADAVAPAGRTRLGSLLAGIGHQVDLTDDEVAVFTQPDQAPAEPIDLQ